MSEPNLFTQPSAPAQSSAPRPDPPSTDGTPRLSPIVAGLVDACQINAQGCRESLRMSEAGHYCRTVCPYHDLLPERAAAAREADELRYVADGDSQELPEVSP